MNPNNSNSGGWSNSYMRKLVPAPTDTVMAALPLPLALTVTVVPDRVTGGALEHR